MSHLADRFVVILDANVLYPFRKRDILLRFYQAGLFRARWTEEIMSEWTENLIKSKPALKKSVESQKQAMETHFPEAWINGYEALTPGLSLPDKNDAHVLAAAIKCDAQHIVTENLKDFPEDSLSPYGIEAISADEFLSRTFELYPDEALVVLKQLRVTYKNPPYEPSEFIMDLISKGLPLLAAHLKEKRAFL